MVLTKFMGEKKKKEILFDSLRDENKLKFKRKISRNVFEFEEIMFTCFI